jgi:sporulation protein YlmC with PRC-barrel domain
MISRHTQLMIAAAAAIAMTPLLALGQTAGSGSTSTAPVPGPTTAQISPSPAPGTGTSTQPPMVQPSVPTAQAPASRPDGTPGNPPSTAIQRGADQVTGAPPTPPDGTAGNPPGTAVGRAIDRALGTNLTGANPTGSSTTTTTTTTTGAPALGMAIDSTTAREGRRASRVIGANVYGANNESIGEVDDIIFSRDGSGQMVAVLSVGGFLGIGAKLVAVPYSQLQWNSERNTWTLPSATRDNLTALPSWTYGDDRRG